MKLITSCITYFLYFIGIVIVYVIITIILSYIPINKKAINEKGNIPIYILTNGVHTDIATPFSNDIFDWSRHLNLSVTPQPLSSANWVAFGWGDKGFYLQTPEWKDLKPSVALKAALYLSTSAMHVTYYSTMQEGEDCKLIWVTEEQYQALCKYIYQSFDLQEGKFILIDTDQNYGSQDVFYEALGKYSLFYTCNTWASDALKAANQKTSLFTLWDKGIFYHYK